MAEIVVVGGGTDPNACSLGSSYALVTSGATYLLDCGESCGTRLRRYGIDPLSVRAVFISHMHCDHMAGLFGFLTSVWITCRREQEIPPAVLEWASRARLPDSALPDSLTVAVPQESVLALEGFLPAVYLAKELWHFDLSVRAITPGAFYEDAIIKASAYPNQHLASQPTYVDLPEIYPWLGLESYSFAVEVDGRRLVYSGDLALLGKKGVEEFRPVAQEADVLIAEIAHVPPEHHLEMLATTKAKQIILVHQHGGLADRVAAFLRKHPDERFVLAQNGMRVPVI